MSVNKFLILIVIISLICTRVHISYPRRFPSLATMMICYQMYVIIVKTKPDIIYTG